MKKEKLKIIALEIFFAVIVFILMALIVEKTLITSKWDYLITDLYYSEDKYSTNYINEQTDSLNKEDFKEYHKDILNFGMTNSTYWIKFKLKNFDSNETLYINLDNPNMNYIDLYIPTSGNGKTSYILKQSGIARGAKSNEIQGPSWNFEIPSSYNGDYIYMSFKNSTTIRGTLSVYSNKNIYDYLFKEHMIEGILIGIIVTVIGFNLFIFSIFKEKNYLIYLLYMITVLIFNMRLTGFIFIEYNVPLTIYMNILWISTGLSGILPILLTKYFLKTDDESNKLNFTFSLFIFICIAEIVLGISGYDVVSNKLCHYVGIILPLIILAYSIDKYLKGVKISRSYMRPWFFSFGGMFIYSLSAFKSFTHYPHFYLIIGTSIEFILLSFTLSEKIKQIIGEREKIKVSRDYFKELIDKDTFTLLYNKNKYFEVVERLIENVKIKEHSLYIAVIDIDNFKNINDKYGHDLGDNVIKGLAQTIIENIRKEDFAFRYGGEEFVILLNKTNYEAAINIVEKIRIDFSKKEFLAVDNIFSSTISIGFSKCLNEDTKDSIFKRGDEALYQSKRTGKNKISIR